jgi:protoheme IX farnesyltransferase
MSTDVLIANTSPPAAPKPGFVRDAVEVAESTAVQTSVTKTSSAEGSSFSISAQWSDYVQLTKPRIVVMILITTIMTAMIAAGGFVPVGQLVWLLVGTGMVAASAGAANQVWERIIDRNMSRTAHRPLPAGRLGAWTASTFTAVLGIAGTCLLHGMFGMAPALAGVATWSLYVLVYTPMKTRTAWNTTVGAIAGALPVLIGYTALGGTLADATGWLLVGVLAAWQYPHFMSIAWLYRRQYHEAGFRMTTTVEPSGRSAGWQSIVGSLALIACGVTLCLLPGLSVLSVIASALVVASAYPMLKASLRFAAAPGDVLARKLLRSSLLVLPAVLAIVTLRVFW